MAAELDACPTDAASKALWTRTAEAVGADLWKIGASEAEIDHQLEQFGQAVSAELVRRAS